MEGKDTTCTERPSEQNINININTAADENADAIDGDATNDVTTTPVVQRRAPRVSSAHGRLQTLGLRPRAAQSIDAMNIPFEAMEFETRKRSHSAPLTIEATKVANELKRLSDALNFYYTAVKKNHVDGQQLRRHTFSERRRADTVGARQTFHFDYDNYFVDESSETNPSATSL